MCGRCVMVVYCKLEPVMRLFCQRSCDRCEACIFNLLADFHEFFPCGVCTGDFCASLLTNRFVYEHAFPVSVKRNCVFLIVCRTCRNHFVLHVGCIIRIYGTDFINGYNLASLYKRVGVVSVEVEQYIGFCAGFKVGNNTGLKGFICAS